jgi:hypothetical protein
VSRPAVKRRAWRIATTRIPFFECIYHPIRAVILAAIEQALSEETPKDSDHDS